MWGSTLMHHFLLPVAVLAMCASLFLTSPYAHSQAHRRPGTELPELGADTGMASLKEVKKRERILTIRKRLIAEQGAAKEREEEIARLTALVQSGASSRFEDDERILRYMQAQDSLPGVINRLRQDRDRSLRLMQLLKAAAGEEYADERIVTYVRQAGEALRRILKRQGEHQKRLAKIKRAIQKGRRDVSPPQHFANTTGLKVVLLTGKEHSFYLSEKLVSCHQFGAFLRESTTGAGGLHPQEADQPMTGLTWDLARQFCRWLSVQENATYRLPTTEEAALIGDHFPCAIWTNSAWEGPNAAARKVRERFGVAMKVAWDPNKKFGAGSVVGELPFASYDHLAFAVVTSRRTGRIHRWNRLRTKK